MQLQQAYSKVTSALLKQRAPDTGVWTGRLSSSALSTALAVTVLEDGDESDCHLARRGAQWLVDSINSDGGWGDTPASPSNVSTSLIARACITHHNNCMGIAKALTDSGAYIMYETGGLSVRYVAEFLENIYGEDRTFAVPILMYLAICGGDEKDWLAVPRIPFYLALLPQWCFRFFKIEVVSYALPALIAVGLCCHIRAAKAQGHKPWGQKVADKLLVKLESIQPEHGGFLDAVPLTAFIVLALKNCGFEDSPVVAKGMEFLRQSVRDDFTWPIDSNLRCWLTSLSARALSEEITQSPELAKQTVSWLLEKQHWCIHPYTGAKPGGWAWTDLPGGVPDADDTAAALVALYYLKDTADVAPLTKAVRLGLTWLMDLQNRDGGIPTFCRGWGCLPFDQSCCDITAHCIEAFSLWRDCMCANSFVVFDDRFIQRMEQSLERMIEFVESQQDEDGAWFPLWFGHQECADKRNKIFGTARVLSGLHVLKSSASKDESVVTQISPMIEKSESLLIRKQKKDGGWSAGTDSTIEETALVVNALAQGGPESGSAAEGGAAWLADMILNNEITSQPIGLYFSVLWYDEILYPLIWSVMAFKSISHD